MNGIASFAVSLGEFAGIGPDLTEMRSKFPEYQRIYLDTILKEKISRQLAEDRK